MHCLINQNNSVYIEKNIIDNDTTKKLIKDILFEVKTNPGHGNNPPLQTYPNLLEIYKKSHWKKYKKVVKEFVVKNLKKDVEFQKTWANVTVPGQKYYKHRHPDIDFSTVLYLQNAYPFFGTRIEDNLIVPGEEKSIMGMSGNMEHKVEDMPYELAVKNIRITIASNFNYV